jgi:hypothetical protein
MSEPSELLADMMSLLTELRATLSSRAHAAEFDEVAPEVDWRERGAVPEGDDGAALPLPVGDGQPYRETFQQLQAEVTHWQQQSVELQNLAISVREELEQTRGQRNVAWRELETVRRRWQQEVSEYEQRLNVCRAERDRLQRELEAIRAGGASREDSLRPGAPAEPGHQVTAPGPASSGTRVSSESAPAPIQRGRDLRRVFLRLRDRDAQAPAESTACPCPNSTATRSSC